MPEVYILTGDKHSGKTTSLSKWVENRNDVDGILSPVVDGKRYFVDVATKETFPMEATGDEEILLIGKYKFSKQAFAKANSIIRTAAQKKNTWLIIDEIGPLELENEGFSDVLKEVLQSDQMKILLVVRNDILQQVIKYFAIDPIKIFQKEDLQFIS